jgi:hypothetical protein
VLRRCCVVGSGSVVVDHGPGNVAFVLVVDARWNAREQLFGIGRFESSCWLCPERGACAELLCCLAVCVSDILVVCRNQA